MPDFVKSTYVLGVAPDVLLAYRSRICVLRTELRWLEGILSLSLVKSVINTSKVVGAEISTLIVVQTILTVGGVHKTGCKKGEWSLVGRQSETAAVTGCAGTDGLAMKHDTYCNL